MAAERLHVDCHAVAGPDRRNGASHGFNHADHLVTDGDARHGARDAAVLDMQVACADAGERHTDNCVPRVEQDGFGLFNQRESSRLGIGIGKH